MVDRKKKLHETDAKPYSRNIFADPEPCNEQKTDKEQEKVDKEKKDIFDKSSQRNLLDVLGGHPDLFCDVKSEFESRERSNSRELSFYE